MNAIIDEIPGFEDEYELEKARENRDYRATLRHCGRGGVELSVHCVKPTFESKEPGPAREMTEAEREERDRLNLLRSVRRARQSLRLLVKTMGADRLLTLTWRENMQDVEQAQKAWQAFVRHVRLRYPNNKFLCVRELQERGAIHLHVALAGHMDIHWLRASWYKALGHKVKFDYDALTGKKRVVAFVKDGKEWRESHSDETLGSINIRARNKRWGDETEVWNSTKIAGYLTKYLDKTFENSEDGKRRFWPSKNCERPVIKKFWLGATNVIEAIKEAHDIVHDKYAYQHLKLWLSVDYMNIWLCGVGAEPPF